MKKSYVIILLLTSSLGAMITRHAQSLEQTSGDPVRDNIVQMIMALEKQCFYSVKSFSKLRRDVKYLGNTKEDGYFMSRLQQLCDDLREMINEKLPRIKEALSEIK